MINPFWLYFCLFFSILIKMNNRVVNAVDKREDDRHFLTL